MHGSILAHHPVLRAWPQRHPLRAPVSRQHVRALRAALVRVAWRRDLGGSPSRLLDPGVGLGRLAPGRPASHARRERFELDRDRVPAHGRRSLRRAFPTATIRSLPHRASPRGRVEPRAAWRARAVGGSPRSRARYGQRRFASFNRPTIACGRVWNPSRSDPTPAERDSDERGPDERAPFELTDPPANAQGADPDRGPPQAERRLRARRRAPARVPSHSSGGDGIRPEADAFASTTDRSVAPHASYAACPARFSCTPRTSSGAPLRATSDDRRAPLSGSARPSWARSTCGSALRTRRRPRRRAGPLSPRPAASGWLPHRNACILHGASSRTRRWP